MNTNSTYKRLAVLAGIFVILAATNVQAQAKGGLPPTDSLYQQVMKMDSILFSAFNLGKFEVLAEVFDTTLEFYHDRGGLTLYQENLKNSAEVRKVVPDLRRDLVPGTTEIYPIPGYGAMQYGHHRFCHDDNGREDCGTFQFMHIWQNKNGKWKLTRVISYDHK